MAIPIKIAIIEDEESAIRRLQKELSKLKDFNFEVLSILKTVTESCIWISQHTPDLIFMDIHLSDGISFEIFNQVEISCPVIFTTAYDTYALKAFKVNGLDYLLKPIDPQELQDALSKYQNTKASHSSIHYMDQLEQFAQQFMPKTYRSSFLVSYKQKMLLIAIQDVAYFYVKERAVFLCKKDGKEFLVDFFLDELEKQLDPNLFYRANRQFLVARSSITEIEPYFTGRLLLMAKPANSTPIIISKEKATDFKRWADY